MDYNGDSSRYRPNVGVCLLNRDGLVWMGRTTTSGPEIVVHPRDWQMPQGGLESGEDIEKAAQRELWEETGITNAKVLKITEEWWDYDFPPGYRASGHKLDPFKGQRQRWVALRFCGDDSEVDITADHTDEPQEFIEWRWMGRKEALDRAVSFKLEQYNRVFSAFDALITP